MSLKEKIENINPNFWAMLMYISSLILMFPLSNIILPLILWLYKKDESEFLDEHGRQVLNFQINLTIYFIGFLIIAFAFSIVTTLLHFFKLSSFFLLTIVIVSCLLEVIELVSMIYGAVQVYHGKRFKIPYIYKFLKKRN